MSTHPQPHQGLGVAQYAWCTSPLRRYADLFNQQQLCLAIAQGASAKLTTPYPPKDPKVFERLNGFESQYKVLQDFQKEVEQYWTLIWLERSQQRLFRAQVTKDKNVRLLDCPLFHTVGSLPAGVARGTEVVLQLVSVDPERPYVEFSLQEVVGNAAE